MKEIIVISLILFFFHIFSFSQPDSTKHEFTFYNKGNNVLGMGVSGGWGRGRIVALVKPSYGRFITNKIAVGLNSGFQTNGLFYNAASVAPFARYYFLNKKLSPFAELDYRYSYSVYSNGTVKNSPERSEFKSQAIHLQPGIGLSFIVFNRFGIESKIRYSYLTFLSYQAHRWYHSPQPVTNGKWIRMSKSDSQKMHFLRDRLFLDFLDFRFYF